MNYELISKKTGDTHYADDEVWQQIVELKLTRNYIRKKIESFKLPTINKQILKPVIEKAEKPKSKTKK
jgi:hypothetical protein